MTYRAELVALSIVVVWASAGPVYAQSADRADDAGARAQSVSLQRVLERTAAHNETWGITAARIEQARAARRRALAGLLPTVSVQASGVRNGEDVAFGGEQVTPKYDWSASGRASIAVFDGTQYPIVSRAGQLLDASRALAKWRRQSVRFEATRAFYTLAAAQGRVDITRRAVELRRAQLQRARAMVDAEIAVKLDVERAKTQWLQAKQDAVVAQAGLGNAADALATIMGAEPGEPIRAHQADATLDEPPERAAVAGLEQRADFRATRHQIEAINLEKSSVWWQFLPLIDLGANARLGPASAFSNPDGFRWSLTLSATWVLYDGGARFAQLDQLDAQVDEQSLIYRRQRRQAAAGLRGALRDWQSARAAVDVARQQVVSATRAFESARQRFEHGLNTSIEVTDASDRLFDAQVGLNQRVFQTRRAAAEYRYLRGLVTSDN